MDDKQFVHNLNNRLAVAYGNGKLVMKRLGEENLAQNLAEVQSRMGKLIVALEEASALIKERSSAAQHGDLLKKSG
jgi:hypothetical protein